MQHVLANIGQVARKYDLTLRTLRFYEQRGLLQPMRQGNSRLYTARDQIRLELILKGRKLGFTLTEIEALIAASSDKAVAHMPREDETKRSDDLVEHLSRRQMEAQLAQLERQKETIQSGIDELRKALEARETEAA